MSGLAAMMDQLTTEPPMSKPKDRQLVQSSLQALLIISLSLTGCQNQQSAADRDMRTARAVQHPMLVNIPLPRGFVSLDDRNLAYESGSTRIARYEFEGDASRVQVHEFFLEHMRSAGFRLLQRRDDEGVVRLTFRSSKEECVIRIGSRGMKTYFIVEVMPLPQGPAPEAEDFPPDRAG